MLKKMRTRNIMTEGFWILTLSLCFLLIMIAVSAQYREVGLSSSVRNFLAGIRNAYLLHIFLTLLWWFLLNVEFMPFASLRSYAESHAFLLSAIFCAIATLTTLLLYLNGHIIDSANQENQYALSCVFVLPATFIAMMYGFPPLHVNYVILPWRGIPNLALKILVVLCSLAFVVYLFAWNFML